MNRKERLIARRDRAIERALLAAETGAKNKCVAFWWVHRWLELVKYCPDETYQHGGL